MHHNHRDKLVVQVQMVRIRGSGLCQTKQKSLLSTNFPRTFDTYAQNVGNSSRTLKSHGYGHQYFDVHGGGEVGPIRAPLGSVTASEHRVLIVRKGYLLEISEGSIELFTYVRVASPVTDRLMSTATACTTAPTT